MSRNLVQAQGGLEGMKDQQLKNYFGQFNNLINNAQSLNGSILTYGSAYGLPYYSLKLIDLSYPANLAFLKDSLTSNSSTETVTKLKQLNINYLLINLNNIGEIDTPLNNTLIKIIYNPQLANISSTFGDWKLYKLG